MPLFQFRGGKDKIKKLLEEGKFEEVLEKAKSDKKTLNHIIELLDDKNPGIVGDALLILTSVYKENPNINIDEKLVKKVLSFILHTNQYIKENAMTFAMAIAENMGEQFKEIFREEISRLLREGGKQEIAFALLLIQKLKLSEFRGDVEKLVSVEDKVILPFEGLKWVKVGDIAKNVLDHL
ncbi:hypothetical protein PFDSM3638_07480 [Pyrococcus furiosus DSM 3638]|uniref:HEAT repeat domain-containing protein n=3 Tax=Pyrococcus furiosus TaxID=2261 RepID=Q8U0U3_PYRFU|nr:MULTISPECIES: hypothetical protein [Pyrococcus]AAL81613.1 hypothetical protein PF1489 [Pyrococcus furiosus DSM 3638]AFN04272.1 hypothetical protein PFC_06680 [Pyrococcus furiosus COM1]MDK2870615.1 hypothetical protein [Pyrococcus sp.]QEK79116.1 hypothetical protein PFDSM3638_07480 [Pyrococcus furiosus DSM 3638]